MCCISIVVVAVAIVKVFNTPFVTVFGLNVGCCVFNMALSSLRRRAAFNMAGVGRVFNKVALLSLSLPYIYRVVAIGRPMHLLVYLYGLNSLRM